MTLARRLRPLVLCAASVLLMSSPARGDDRPWLEVTTPNFVVISNSGEKEARQVAWQFEQVRSVFKTLWPWARTESGRKFVVFAVRNAATLKSLAPRYWEEKGVKPAAVYVSSYGKDYVAIQTDVPEPGDEGVNPYSMAYSGYADIVLNAAFSGQVPLWYRTGLSELFANSVVRQKDVHVGRIVPWHMEALHASSVPLLRVFMATTRESPDYADLERRRSYDAEAWVFVHYLVFGEKGARLAQLNRYSALLQSGTNAEQAFAQAFGDLAAIESGFRAYLTQRLYQYARYPIDLNVKMEAFPSRALAPAAVLAAQAGFHAAMRRPVEARALLAQAKQADASLAAVYEVEGALADAENKDDEARVAFARAAELGSESFHVHSRLGSLLWRGDPDRETYLRIAAAFEKAAQLNPDDAWSHSSLADARLNADRSAQVVPQARRAVEIAPAESYHHRVLARALFASGDTSGALAEARRAKSLATDDGKRAEAQGLVDWIAGQAAPAASAPATAAGPGTSGSQSAAAPLAPGNAGDPIKFPCDDPKSAQCSQWAAFAAEACEKGELKACFAAAWTLEKGSGVAQDLPRALTLYQQTCDGGLGQGCTWVAVYRLNKDPRHPAAVRPLLQKACDAGDPDGCRLLKSLPK